MKPFDWLNSHSGKAAEAPGASREPVPLLAVGIDLGTPIDISGVIYRKMLGEVSAYTLFLPAIVVIATAIAASLWPAMLTCIAASFCGIPASSPKPWRNSRKPRRSTDAQ